MDTLILTAIPFFFVFMAVEILTLRHVAHEHGGDAAAPVGYEARDTATSLSMGSGNLVITAAWKLVMIAVYAGLYELTPLRIPEDAWWAWVLLFFADDLAFYLYHRGHHRIRMFWATHVVHHSSQHYNLSTALRQDWSPFTGLVFWLWLPLIGFKPWMIVLAHTWSLLYQFLLHTETVRKLPRPIEWIFNTPSHHRVHHGVQDQYLDRNYGGILIVWDRLFGTFEPEGERVRYGLTTNIDTFNPVRVAYHEWAALARDVRHARSWRERLGYAFRGPGWAPAADRSQPPPGAAPAIASRVPAEVAEGSGTMVASVAAAAGAGPRPHDRP